MATGRGTLLEQLFIRVDAKYDGREMKQADRDVDKLEGSVEKLNTALNAMTAALGAAALAGLNAFTQWDTTLTRLAGKAGTTRRAFDREFGAISGSIGREVALEKGIVAGFFQQQKSLGGSGNELVRMAAILEAAGIAQGSDVVENSIRIGDYFDEDPAVIADKITKAAQVGAGDSGDYYKAFGLMMQMAEAFGINTNQLAGMTTVLAKVAPTIPQGATQLEGFLSAMNNPTKQTEEALAAIGLTPDSVKKSIRENPVEFFKELSKFSNDQINALTPGNKESFKLIRGFVKYASLIEKNTKDVAENYKGTVAGIQEDRASSWENVWRSFKNSIVDLLERFGKPFAALLKPAFEKINSWIDSIVKLDEETGGLIMWIAALVSGMLFLKLALIHATKVFGLMKGIGRMIGGGSFLGGGAKSAGSGKGGGFWKGVAGALGFVQFRDAILGAGKWIGKLAGLFRLLTGPVGIIVSLFSALGLISSKARPDAAHPEDIDTSKANTQASLMMIYAEALLNDIWRAIKESFMSLGQAVKDDVTAALAIFFGQNNAAKIVEAIADMLGAVADVFAALWNYITNPIDTLKLAWSQIKKGSAWAAMKTLEGLHAVLVETPAAHLQDLEEQAERGTQEWLTPSGDIIDRAMTPPAGGMAPPSGGNNVTITNDVNVDARGADDPQAVGDATAEGVQRVMQFQSQSWSSQIRSENALPSVP